jgi:hypothetical protein
MGKGGEAMGYNQQAVSNLSGEDQFFSAMGRFISEFSQLEYALKLSIAKKVGVKGRHIPAVMSHDFGLTCTIAQEILSEIVDPKDLKKFKTFINKCKSLNDHRVRVAHGLWSIRNWGGVLQHVSRQNFQIERHYQEPAVLAGLADDAAVLRFELVQILRSIEGRERLQKID